MKTEKRKLEHLEICLNKDVNFKEKTTMLEDVELIYKALPEISKKEISLKTTFLEKDFDLPFMVSAITGGTKKAEQINKDIAKACQALGIAMQLGSQRAMLEDNSLTETYFVRDVAPDIFLLGNIGVAQLEKYSINEIKNMLDSVEANALCVHINAAQEIIQKEGDHDFRGMVKRIKRLADQLPYPIVVKEVGHGISREIASELAKTKISAIDIQGSGGTSWIMVDAYRDKNSFVLGKIFRDFGIPTAASLLEVRSVFKRPIIASGGIRNGLECAKCFALGASLCGLALPVLRAQSKQGFKGVERLFNNLAEELKIAMFMTGSKNIEDLKKADYILKDNLAFWYNQRIKGLI
ncbi:MAG: type 2 isopentenyl-diphosphate Delta-isomerase [Candidatus Diapherotrites archaeon]|nr:type 2 isopentenyl-diphosphate Delta-isomerase [Candidatus Diapherotrites archaeon]